MCYVLGTNGGVGGAPPAPTGECTRPLRWESVGRNALAGGVGGVQVGRNALVGRWGRWVALGVGFRKFGGKSASSCEKCLLEISLEICERGEFLSAARVAIFAISR